jgi:hypothetical protein
VNRSGNSYNDSWIKSKFTELESQIQQLKNINSYMTGESGFSYDPQLPYHFHRKNERFQYALFDLIVTNPSAESTLNTMGEAGWYIAGMSIVNENTGSASFTFKLNLQSDDVNPTKFQYQCFSYELASTFALEEKINSANKQGFDLTSTSAWNKTHGFCLLTKVYF